MAERFVLIREHFGAISGAEVSQRAMAERLGVAKNTWQRYETGDMPSATVLVSLATEGINSHWLLTGQGEMFAFQDRLPASTQPAFGQNAGDRRSFDYLSEIAVEAKKSPTERAAADLLLDVEYGDPQAADRREGRLQATFAELHAATAAYTKILKELNWKPPALTGMSIRDAMFTDGLSHEAARFILTAIKADCFDKDAEE